MKITIERADLLKSLNHVQSIVEKRNTIPILSNVRLDADDKGLSFKATDMDIEITETVNAEIEEKGSLTTSAHMLYDIVRKLPDGSQVKLHFADDMLSLSAGRSRFSLSCLPVEDFPVISDGKLPTNFSITAADLRGLIDRTKFAISTEETRYYLNGIYLHTNESNDVEVMRAAATDGHRLACVEMPVPEGAKDMPGIIIPRKVVNELRKLIDETGMDVDISLSDSKIRFTFDDIVLTSRLIDGTYPDYERVIPTDNDKKMEINAKLLANAVDRVSVVSEKSKGIKIAISKGKINISASSIESGSAEEELDAQYDSDDIEIGFNSRYMLDIMHQIEGDTVSFTMSDSASPTIVHDISDEGAIYVLMPMRV
ncbi:MAG: DNA polymerase III subunit beta [Alphaproteobacteria bacterium]|nr:DNA polymerase III subunit beta [Alphaproteobacteria bacterium]